MRKDFPTLLADTAGYNAIATGYPGQLEGHAATRLEAELRTASIYVAAHLEPGRLHTVYSDTTNLFFRLESLPYDWRRIVATLTTRIGRRGEILTGEFVAAGMTDRLVVTHAEVLAPTDSPPSSDPQPGLLMLGARESISVTQPPSTASRLVFPPAPAQLQKRAPLLTVGHQPRVAAQTLRRNRPMR